MPTTTLGKGVSSSIDTMDNKENERASTDSSSGPMSSSEIRKMTPAKHDKLILHEFDGQVKEIRAQLTEQLKSVGERTEIQVAVLTELEDFYRKLGEAEAENAIRVEKLAKATMQRHKAEKNRRDAWAQHSASSVFQQVVDDAREAAQQKQFMADFYQKVITSSIGSRCDDLAKISKRCREIGALSHSEINRVLNELQTAMKTYQICHTELVGVEKKLRAAEEDKRRYEEANKGKSPSRKLKSLTKYYNRREEKYALIRYKCTKARNEYLMCVRAANAALHRFFADDLSYLIDCMDLGLDFWLKSLLDHVIDVRKRLTQREMDSLAELGTLRSSLDSKADKQRFFEAHHATFMLPKQFEFRPQIGDDISTVSAERGLMIDLSQRQKQIEKRLHGLRLESDELWKTLEACERHLHELYRDTPTDLVKWRKDVLDAYQYYLEKFECFLLNGNLIERLEARTKAIVEALVREGEPRESLTVISDDITRKKIRRIGGTAPDLTQPRPKLFGGSLDEYVEATGECIPLVVMSAIGYLSRFSLRNQGLFRISGSQSEITRYKECYERGEDAFSDLVDGSESNSVAGVLKLYLRELREPLFPIFLFDQFTDCAKADSPQDFIRKTRELISKLPVCNILLLRYLFGFLSHLCEFADENMMEPHSLAICFGPTLLPIPEGKDQVFYHNYVNELVRGLIVHSLEVFPSEPAGPLYDKYVISTASEHLGYMDDGDASEDEDVIHQHMSHNDHDNMLDSTYEMSISTDADIPPLPRITTNVQVSPKEDIYSQPSLSSRSSNRSAFDDHFRRTSEENTTPPLLRTDIPSRIANELTVKFAQRDQKEREKTISPLSRPIWETERPDSHASTISQSSTGYSVTRMPVMTSLRDQLQHLRRELNVKDDNAKVYPLSDGLQNGKTQRISLLNDNTILDARGSSRSCDSAISRHTPCDQPSSDASSSASSNDFDDSHIVRRRSDVQSDIYSSTTPTKPLRGLSPPLEELAAALKEAKFD
ncbi:unnamed protein product [Auanema sp. JU1783]|nr:unnamed protein product [Auanema sp. JU1783]